MKRWKKNLLVLALLSFAVIFANVTPKYHTVSAASKTTLNYKKKTLSKGQTLKLKVKGTKKKVKCCDHCKSWQQKISLQD